jgi:hypothetical protein
MPSVFSVFRLEAKLESLKLVFYQLENVDSVHIFHEVCRSLIANLSSLSQIVRSKANSFADRFPACLILKCRTYLSPFELISTGQVCHTWWKALSSSIAYKTLTVPYLPTGGTLVKKSKVPLPKFSSFNKGELLISTDGKDITSYNVETGISSEVVNDSFTMGFCHSDTTLITLANLFQTRSGVNRVNRATGESSTIYKFEESQSFAIFLKENRLYLATNKRLHSFQFGDKESSSAFSFASPIANRKRLLVSSTGEIFVLNDGKCQIQVYSAEGSLLREWGECGKQEGQFLKPWAFCFGLDESILYVTDCLHRNIQAFNRFGRYLFKIDCSFADDLADIYSWKDYLVVTDWISEGGSIFLIKLLRKEEMVENN